MEHSHLTPGRAGEEHEGRKEGGVKVGGREERKEGKREGRTEGGREGGRMSLCDGYGSYYEAMAS